MKKKKHDGDEEKQEKRRKEDEEKKRKTKEERYREDESEETENEDDEEDSEENGEDVGEGIIIGEQRLTAYSGPPDSGELENNVGKHEADQRCASHGDSDGNSCDEIVTCEKDAAKDVARRRKEEIKSEKVKTPKKWRETPDGNRDAEGMHAGVEREGKIKQRSIESRALTNGNSELHSQVLKDMGRTKALRALFMDNGLKEGKRQEKEVKEGKEVGAPDDVLVREQRTNSDVKMDAVQAIPANGEQNQQSEKANETDKNHAPPNIIKLTESANGGRELNSSSASPSPRISSIISAFASSITSPREKERGKRGSPSPSPSPRLSSVSPREVEKADKRKLSVGEKDKDRDKKKSALTLGSLSSPRGEQEREKEKERKKAFSEKKKSGQTSQHENKKDKESEGKEKKRVELERDGDIESWPKTETEGEHEQKDEVGKERKKDVDKKTGLEQDGQDVKKSPEKEAEAKEVRKRDKEGELKEPRKITKEKKRKGDKRRAQGEKEGEWKESKKKEKANKPPKEERDKNTEKSPNQSEAVGQSITEEALKEFLRSEPEATQDAKATEKDIDFSERKLENKADDNLGEAEEKSNTDDLLSTHADISVEQHVEAKANNEAFFEERTENEIEEEGQLEQESKTRTMEPQPKAQDSSDCDTQILDQRDSSVLAKSEIEDCANDRQTIDSVELPQDTIPIVASLGVVKIQEEEEKEEASKKKEINTRTSNMQNGSSQEEKQKDTKREEKKGKSKSKRQKKEHKAIDNETESDGTADLNRLPSSRSIGNETEHSETDEESSYPSSKVKLELARVISDRAHQLITPRAPIASPNSNTPHNSKLDLRMHNAITSFFKDTRYANSVRLA